MGPLDWFDAGFSRPLTTDEKEGLRPRLEPLIDAAARAWPEVKVAPERFLAFVAQRLDPELDPAGALAVTAVTDLYLACGCADGLPGALAQFERSFLPEVDRVLRQRRAECLSADEIKALVRERLFVPVDGRVRIAEYAGHGGLTTWLRVVIARIVADFYRERRPLGEVVDLDPELAAPLADPELEHIRRQYHSEFNAALAEAARSLTVRQRNLLRHQHVHGLRLDQIAALYRVHRATAGRWLERARETLSLRTQRAFARRVSLSGSELDLAMRFIWSQIDISARRLLLSEDDPSR